MKVIGYFFGGCVILAIVRAAAVAVILLIVLAIVTGAIFKPRETSGILGLLLIANLFAAFPIGCLIVGIVWVGVASLKSRPDT